MCSSRASLQAGLQHRDEQLMCQAIDAIVHLMPVCREFRFASDAPSRHRGVAEEDVHTAWMQARHVGGCGLHAFQAALLARNASGGATRRANALGHILCDCGVSSQGDNLCTTGSELQADRAPNPTSSARHHSYSAAQVIDTWRGLTVAG